VHQQSNFIALVMPDVPHAAAFLIYCATALMFAMLACAMLATAQTSSVHVKSLLHVSLQIFALNSRVLAQNRAPIDFPGFIREGFDITVIGEGYVMDQAG
jgi:hypothetical protein